MGTRKTIDRNGGSEGRKTTIIAPIIVGVVIALVAGGTSPWWWAMVFPSKQEGSPIIMNQSGRLHRIASNNQCQGDERSWVYITNDKSVRIGLVGVNLEEGRVDIRVIQARDGKTTRDDVRLYRDRTLPLRVGNFEMYIKPQIDDCWVDYEIYPTSK